MKKYISLLRISHYVKNLYIFLPMFFSGEITYRNILCSLLAFIAFSLAASSIYIFNDINDIDQDRLHPVKKFRPIPSGQVGLTACYILFALLISASLSIAVLTDMKLMAVIGVYFVLNILYSLWLKHIAIVDVAIVSIGFVLRVLAGGLVCGIVVSKWLIIMVFLLSLFQAFSKRMDDIHILNEQNITLRKSLQGYNQEFLQIVTSLLCGVLMVCYVMYITSPEVEAHLGTYAYFTTLFVLLGLLRYLQICFVFKQSGSPVKILMKDIFIKICILLWLCSFVFLIFVLKYIS